MLPGLQSQADAQPADLIIVNGRLFTSKPSSEPMPVSQPGTGTSIDPSTSKSNDTDSPTALAVRGARIVKVGSDAQIESLAGPLTRRIDARQATVTAGLHDAHVHFLSGSLALSQIDLSTAMSEADIERIIKDYLQANPNREVYEGRGWLYGCFPSGLPDQGLLNKLIPDKPAIMKCYDGHTVWVNSKALQAAGITRQSKDPEAGVIVRDPSTGEPSGVLKESAQLLVQSIIPQPSLEDKLTALGRGVDLVHSLGVTAVFDAGVGLNELSALDSLNAAGRLQLRYAIALDGKPGMSPNDLDQLQSLKRRFSKLDIRAVKLFVDGVIEAHTAALLQPYANRASKGLPETTPEQLTEIVSKLDAQQWQIMVHAIGDGGIRMTLDAFDQAARNNATPAQGRRHRIEHIESIDPADVGRFGTQRVIASMQPYHANPNSNVFNVWAANLGPQRAGRAWMWKTIQSRGGRLAFGSDWPVVGLDPRLGMHTALTRQTLDGQPPGGFVPTERLPLSEVLRAYTSDAAYAQFAEREQGQLAEGYLADIVIWDRDLFSLPVDRVHTATVSSTIFNGQIVYTQK